MTVRFFIRGTEDTRKQLAHAAIDLDSSAEKLGGELLRRALEQLFPQMLSEYKKQRSQK